MLNHNFEKLEKKTVNQWEKIAPFYLFQKKIFFQCDKLIQQPTYITESRNL